MFFEIQSNQIEKWLLNPYLYLVVIGLTLLAFIKGVDRLDKQYWSATIHDYFYGIAYAVIYFPIIVMLLIQVNESIDRYTPWLRLELINTFPEWSKLLFIILIDDFLAYWSHRLRHVVKPLWYFHTIHHSQNRLNPFTTKRFHPLENLFHKVVILSVPMAIIGGSMETWYLYFLLDAVWDYFIHSNLRINLGLLKYILVTPQYHRLHHSIEKDQFDRNFSDRFIIWDVLFGTAYLNFKVYPKTGIPEYPVHTSRQWLPWQFLYTHILDMLYPFRMIFADIFPPKKIAEKDRQQS